MNPESKIFSWAYQILIGQGYRTKKNHQLIKDVPWSKIYCLETSKGRVFLKTMAQPFSIEPILLTFLFENISQNVPKILAVNQDLNCFLMSDSGVCLRDILKTKFTKQYFFHIFQIYADIQIGCIPFTESLIAKSLNDWRLKNLPSLYQNFLNEDSLLKADGLSQHEIEELKKLKPAFEHVCKALANYCIPETLEHADFHDNNILIKDKNITINDLGDACVSHPFFSFLSFFKSAKRHHKITEEDTIYKECQKTYLKKWSIYGNEQTLMKALGLAKSIRPFVFALSFSRIFSCPNSHLFPEYKGYMAEALRELIKRNK